MIDDFVKRHFEPRVERCGRVLENHLQAAAKRPQPGQRFFGDILALEQGLTFGDVVEPQWFGAGKASAKSLCALSCLALAGPAQ